MNQFKTMVAAQIFLILVGLVTFVVGSGVVWVYAPVVGGEWWPYVRVLASIAGGWIFAYICMTAVQIIAMVLVAMNDM